MITITKDGKYFYEVPETIYTKMHVMNYVKVLELEEIVLFGNV